MLVTLTTIADNKNKKDASRVPHPLVYYRKFTTNSAITMIAIPHKLLIHQKKIMRFNTDSAAESECC